MVLIIYVATGVVNGGLILRYLSSENAAKRQERREVEEMSDYAEAFSNLSPTEKFAVQEGQRRMLRYRLRVAILVAR